MHHIYILIFKQLIDQDSHFLEIITFNQEWPAGEETSNKVANILDPGSFNRDCDNLVAQLLENCYVSLLFRTDECRQSHLMTSSS